MSGNKEQFKRILIFFTSLIIIGSFTAMFARVWYKEYNSDMLDPFWQRGNILLIIIYVFIYTLTTRSLSGFKVTYLKPLTLFGSQMLGVIGSNIVVFVIISLIGRGRLSPRPMIYLTIFETAVALVWSFASSFLFKKIYPPRRMIIVYGNKNSTALIEKMSMRQDKYHICSSISCDEDIEKIKEQILRYEAVIISDVPSVMRNKLLKFTLDKSIRAYITPKLSDIIIRGSEDFNLFDTPLLLNRNEGLSFEQRFIKRCFDLIMGIVALLVLSPFMLIAALAVKLYDRGPVFYRQERLTIGGKSFYVFKFRSMVVDAEKHGAQLAGKNDDRITPVGRFLRRIRFDELPQLLNIIKGDMSFVGPRPERPQFCKKYEKTMPEFRYRLKVKAGLTGYAQVMGKYNTTPYDKLKLDLMYIENQSFLMDLKIILMTIKIVFVPDATEGITGDQVETRRELHPQRDERELDKILKE